jgi:hypothetical protein
MLGGIENRPSARGDAVVGRARFGWHELVMRSAVYHISLVRQSKAPNNENRRTPDTGSSGRPVEPARRRIVKMGQVPDTGRRRGWKHYEGERKGLGHQPIRRSS